MRSHAKPERVVADLELVRRFFPVWREPHREGHWAAPGPVNQVSAAAHDPVVRRHAKEIQPREPEGRRAPARDQADGLDPIGVLVDPVVEQEDLIVRVEREILRLRLGRSRG